MDKKLLIFCKRIGIRFDMTELDSSGIVDYLSGYSSVFKLKFYSEDIKDEGTDSKYLDEFLDSIERCRKTTLKNVIYSLNIGNLTVADTTKISNTFNGNGDLFKKAVANAFKTTRLPEYPCLTEAFADMSFREDVLCLLEELEIEAPAPVQATVQTTPAYLPLQGLNIVVTGTLANYTRLEIEQEITHFGGNFQRSITRSTSYVLCGTKPGNTKYNKARQQGIPIIYENDFLKMIGKR